MYNGSKHKESEAMFMHILVINGSPKGKNSVTERLYKNRRYFSSEEFVYYKY